MRASNQSRFAQVPQVQIPRSSFDRSFTHKTTFDVDRLVPVYVDEALPGDTFNLSMTAFARMTTPVYPLMDNLYMESFFFAVPYRLVWDNFEKFMGAQEDPGDSTDYTVPVTTAPSGGWDENSIADYFGLPIGVEIDANAIPFRALRLIWNDWFRDQNLQDSLAVLTGDGPDTSGTGDDLPYKRNKAHDYFTSALPWPQKSEDGAVSIPLGTSANITTDVGASTFVAYQDGSNYYSLDTSGVAGSEIYTGSTTLSESNVLYADLSNATAATINQLRQAFQLQRLLEKDARGGTRYTEIVRSHFGVTSPDARLQRPEYLGGGSSPVNITPIAKTSQEATGTDPLGTLSAMATASIKGHGFTKSFTEHCVIIGLVNVRSDVTYQQGIDRMFTRETRYDFYWPSLAMIGEQEIKNKEIYAQGTSADDETFGYQERYAEYRYKPNRVSGAFRSTATTPLDSWHLAQEFSSLPTLGTTFIEANTPMARVLATPSEPDFYFDSLFNLRCARPMPLYGVPGMLDHF